MISLIHKDHSDKLTAIFPALNILPSIAQLRAKPIKPTQLKQKRDHPAKNRANKQARNLV